MLALTIIELFRGNKQWLFEWELMDLDGLGETYSGPL